MVPITSVSVDAAPITYDGAAKEPALTVMSNEEFTPTSGYDAVYEKNIYVGTATVTVTGKGAYSGTATATFSIAPADLSKAEVNGLAARTYDGNAQTQAPTVRVGSRTLREDTDYGLSYENNVDVGTATMTAAGIGNYTGTVKRTFKIAKAKNPIKIKAIKRTAKASKAKKKAQIVARPINFNKRAKGKVSY